MSNIIIKILENREFTITGITACLDDVDDGSCDVITPCTMIEICYFPADNDIIRPMIKRLKDDPDSFGCEEGDSSKLRGIRHYIPMKPEMKSADILKIIMK